MRGREKAESMRRRERVSRGREQRIENMEGGAAAAAAAAAAAVARTTAAASAAAVTARRCRRALAVLV
mgnify:CR=1 FL=1